MRTPSRPLRLLLRISAAAAILAVPGLSSRAATPATPNKPAPAPQAPAVNATSLRHEIQRAIDLGTAWLEKAQTEQGHWSSPEHPALTALALTALQGDPDSTARSKESRRRILNRGYEHLLRCVQPDGGIYVDRKLVNYNTSVSVMALLLAGRPEYDPVIRRARQVIISKQTDLDTPGRVDHPLDGGVGYGDGSAHSDLVNTMHALEALHLSRRLVRDQPQTAGAGQDLNWDAAIQFIQNCQHVAKVNKQAWVSETPENAGGFVYSPRESKAGEIKLADGRTALRAYASISYAGMLSYIYAGVKADDPRVQAVLDWSKRNYTLEENPGMGPQGLYFYFHTLTKALTAAGFDVLETQAGTRHDWRSELALHLINLQRSGGRWENDNGRWWEKDPVLSTSYALIALEMIHRSLRS